MKALRALRGLTTLSARTHKPHLSSSSFYRFFAAQPQQDNPNDSVEEDNNAVFDSGDYSLPNMGSDSAAKIPRKPTWDEAYRAKADRTIFGTETQKQSYRIVEEDEERRRATMLAKALLQAALEKPDDIEEEDMIVKEEDQRSLSVGIIGAPNAGKSALTNFMVGTKVAAVSRKTNTTTHEVLGVMTKGNTQIVDVILNQSGNVLMRNEGALKKLSVSSTPKVCFFDTPGIILKSGGYPCKTDVKVRVESAWSSVSLYDVLIVIFDVHRHLNSPDKRVIRLIKHLGTQAPTKQKRVLCMNKVDLVEVKKDLLKVAQEFGDLPRYERYFMISGLKGSGVKDLTQYLMEQA
ncbi:hypothetical protein HHK36_000634 [Tetracentron sinense]|uniref:Era-type G domain-containing protein n=1 Tax=Tetracentron sinense TaxID=13715 RepID=A0A835DQX3_TETSI|nr:hypothetical protein HHK36_000634 [Tetracentron sinense]